MFGENTNAVFEELNRPGLSRDMKRGLALEDGHTIVLMRLRSPSFGRMSAD